MSEEIDEDGENGANIILSERDGHFNDTIVEMLSSSYMNNKVIVKAKDIVMEKIEGS